MKFSRTLFLCGSALIDPALRGAAPAMSGHPRRIEKGWTLHFDELISEKIIFRSWMDHSKSLNCEQIRLPILVPADPNCKRGSGLSDEVGQGDSGPVRLLHQISIQ